MAVVYYEYSNDTLRPLHLIDNWPVLWYLGEQLLNFVYAVSTNTLPRCILEICNSTNTASILLSTQIYSIIQYSIRQVLSILCWVLFFKLKCLQGNVHCVLLLWGHLDANKKCACHWHSSDKRNHVSTWQDVRMLHGEYEWCMPGWKQLFQVFCNKQKYWDKSVVTSNRRVDGRFFKRCNPEGWVSSVSYWCGELPPPGFPL